MFKALGRSRSVNGQFKKNVEHDVRKLKAIITLILYGLFLLLMKIMYDKFIQIPEVSNIWIIAFLSFLLVVIVILFDRFSKRILTRISCYTDELEQARLYAENIINSHQIPLLVLNRDAVITSANEAFYTYFVMLGSSTIGSSFFELFDGWKQFPQLKEYLDDRSQESRGLSDLEIELVLPQRGKCILLINGRKFSSQRQQYFLLSFEDITKQREAESNLRLYTKGIEEASRAKSDFLAIISHELRTPLNAIIGFSEIIKDSPEGSISNQGREYSQHIHASATHLLSLIDDILDLSKVEAGKMTLNLERADIAQLLTSSLSIIMESATSKKIFLQVRADEALGEMEVDVRKFRQILYNLLSNAVKFTPEEGLIELMVSKTGTPALLEVVVRDTGIGISSQDQDKLFKPFSQLDSSLNRRYRGTGLGLHLTKRLVELHGGRIWVESQPGRGSRFVFQIPYR